MPGRSAPTGKGENIRFGDVVEAFGMEFDIDKEDIEESEESASVIHLTNRIIEDAPRTGELSLRISTARALMSIFASPRDL